MTTTKMAVLVTPIITCPPSSARQKLHDGTCPLKPAARLVASPILIGSGSGGRGVLHVVTAHLDILIFGLGLLLLVLSLLVLGLLLLLLDVIVPITLIILGTLVIFASLLILGLGGGRGGLVRVVGIFCSGLVAALLRGPRGLVLGNVRLLLSLGQVLPRAFQLIVNVDLLVVLTLLLELRSAGLGEELEGTLGDGGFFVGRGRGLRSIGGRGGGLTLLALGVFGGRDLAVAALDAQGFLLGLAGVSIRFILEQVTAGAADGRLFLGAPKHTNINTVEVSWGTQPRPARPKQVVWQDGGGGRGMMDTMEKTARNKAGGGSPYRRRRAGAPIGVFDVGARALG